MIQRLHRRAFDRTVVERGDGGGACDIRIDAAPLQPPFEPGEGPVIPFKVRLAGDRGACLPADVMVSARLIRRFVDPRSGHLVLEAVDYENRRQDLTPGHLGLWSQKRFQEAYRYELTPHPTSALDMGQKDFDFGAFERIDVTIDVVAANGTSARRKVTLRPRGAEPQRGPATGQVA